MSLWDRLRELFAAHPNREPAKSSLATTDSPALPKTHPRAGRPERSGFHPQLLSGGISFGLRLHQQLAREMPLSNVVISPVSIGFTLAMAANGARGPTRDSIARVLGIENLESKECNEGYAEILRSLRIRGEKVELRLANSLWIDDAHPVRPEFVSECQQFYEGEVVNVSFASADTAPRINRWVSEQTAGKIREIIAQTSAADQLLLLNAAYFLGRWASPFDPAETREEVFHAASGPRKHPMMYQRGWYDYMEGEHFQAIALRYGFYGMALYIVLPSERAGLPWFFEHIDSETWGKLMRGFSHRPGTIALPRFRIDCDLSLVGVLRALGMSEPFEHGRADFSGMFLGDSGSFATEFRHKTFLDVNERGTEAAAATGGFIGAAMKPPPPFRMVVDRPFFLAIRDTYSGLLLFTGSVIEP